MQISNISVSIILPAYNSEKFISNTIDSILNQSYSNWELLITDDSSVDCTVNIVKHYQIIDNRIRLFILPNNSGVALARNNSLKYAKGQYIAFCDSDDIWHYNKLEKQLDFLATHKIGFTCSGYNRYNPYFEFLGSVIPPHVLYYNDLLKYCPIGTSTVILDRSIINNIFFPNIRRRQDYALWLKVFKEIGTTMCMSDVLVDYTVRQNSISSNKLFAARDHFFVLKKYSDISNITAVFYFFHYMINGIYNHKILPYIIKYSKSKFFS